MSRFLAQNTLNSGQNRDILAKCPEFGTLSRNSGRLKALLLRVYSQDRRWERYQICFLWKLSQGLIEGFKIGWQWRDRRGRTANPHPIPHNAPSKVKQARERSLGVHGARLFNILPSHLRNENPGDFALFKNHLDIFLSTVPDQPTTPGLYRAASTNSLLDQVPLLLLWPQPVLC